MKKLYRMRPKVGIMKDFYVFDTETGSRKGNQIFWELNARPEAFIFGVIYGHNYTKVIHSHEEMVETFLEPRFKNRLVFAHNFGRFDGSVLFDNIFKFDSSAIFVGSRFISCTNGNCTFGDSMNIYKASVKQLGAKMGLLKLGMDDGNYQVSTWPEDEARDINGCIRDCQIIYDALIEIFQEAGEIRLTIGSLAMAYYRRFHQPFDIEANENADEFFNSYYGGRTEMFKQGKTNSKVIDVNSMYPFVMRNTTYPNPKFLKIEMIDDVKFFTQNILNNFEGCATCEIDHPEIHIGLLPTRINKKLCFPVGNLSGCWNFNELRFALKHGCKIKSVSKVVYAEPMASPFVSFVDTLYMGKFLAHNEKRGLDEWKYKYLMNNLYGKFGQRIDEETIYIEDVVDQYFIIQEHQMKGTFVRLIQFNEEREDAFLVVKSVKNMEIKHSIPSFASYVTSAGRIMLGEKLLAMKNNKPTYCDTDSIFFEIDDGVESSGVLGEWKIEDKTVTEISGLKNYKFIADGKLFNRIKGVPSKAREITKNHFEFENLTGTKESLRRNLVTGVLMKRTKVIAGTYDKRIVLSNGETKPIKL